MLAWIRQRIATLLAALLAPSGAVYEDDAEPDTFLTFTFASGEESEMGSDCGFADDPTATEGAEAHG